MFMYAVIKASGRQYRVAEGDVITLQRQVGQPGDGVEFADVMLVENEGNIQVGQAVKSAKVTGKILDQTKGKKIRYYRFKRRKNTQKTVGHRPKTTKVTIEKIHA
jgi:large subunit ribosomal protein L21